MLTSTIEVLHTYLATFESRKPIGSCQVYVLGVHFGRGTLFHYSTIISQYVTVATIIHMTKSGPITASLYIVGYYYPIISLPQMFLFDYDQLG
jgi:hypothetical protein